MVPLRSPQWPLCSCQLCLFLFEWGERAPSSCCSRSHPLANWAKLKAFHVITYVWYHWSTKAKQTLILGQFSLTHSPSGLNPKPAHFIFSPFQISMHSLTYLPSMIKAHHCIVMMLVPSLFLSLRTLGLITWDHSFVTGQQHCEVVDRCLETVILIPPMVQGLPR